MLWRLNLTALNYGFLFQGRCSVFIRDLRESLSGASEPLNLGSEISSLLVLLDPFQDALELIIFLIPTILIIISAKLFGSIIYILNLIPLMIHQSDYSARLSILCVFIFLLFHELINLLYLLDVLVRNILIGERYHLREQMHILQ